MNKNKTKKIISLKSYTFSLYILIGVITVLSMLLLIGLGIGFAVTKIDGLLTALLILTPICLIGIMLIGIFLIQSYNNVLYKSFYKNTINNIGSLSQDRKSLNKYDHDNIQEIVDLNDKIDKLIDHMSTIEISPRKYDYSKIPLEYLNKKDNLINESSFKQNIREIIYCSKYLRNGVASISYDGNVALDNNSIQEIVNILNRNLDVEGLLIAVKDDATGFFVYMPAVESLSATKETLENIITKITLSKKTLNGIELLSPRLNIVVYPFSTINDIFSDLHYSERQEERVNVYIPTRYINSTNDSLFEESTNLNNTYKIISSLSSIKAESGHFKEFIEQVFDPLRQAALFYGFDQAGIVLYDRETRNYLSSLAVKFDDNTSFIFPEEKAVPDEFIDSIEGAVDPDKSLFFSKRKFVNHKISKQIDIYDIYSAFFYKACDVNGNNVGLIYFINLNKKSVPLNSYLQSSLMFFCSILSSSISNHLVLNDINEVKEREINLLKYTNIRSYVIDRRTYEVKSFSPSLKKDIPDLELGQLCYKAMFGYDKPCETCPLLSKQKAIKNIRGTSYEVTAVLNNKINDTTELTLSAIDADARSTNQFDKDYLINTNYSFIERLNDLYTVKARGYVALLKIRNIDVLVDKLGSEGLSFVIRRFIKEINDNVLKSNEIYKYKNDTLAIIFSSVGKLDAIEAIEKIFPYSKKHYFPNMDDLELEISYDLTKYPQEHTSSEDFIRHIETLNSSIQDTTEKDYLYIEENDFVRPASKEKYILSIINEATVAKNFIIKAQPMVNGSSKAIFGSELLIRLSDKYYNSLLNTEEVVKIAAKYGKLHNISDILIDFVGELYRLQGVAIFKPAGFTRMSINADYNYFKDVESISKIIEALAKYHLPKEFITFEVTEEEIANHYDSFKEVVTTLRRNDIDIVCDRYYGNTLSFEKLKEIGITEIKSDRSLVVNIDVSSDKFTSLSKLIQNADALKMNLTLVGVENGEQYNLIKSLNMKCNLQGYYFHHPLSSNELIEAIRANNVI